MLPDTMITRDRIAETDKRIRPHIRHTPVLRADLADFGLAPGRLDFKLEFLQHSGTFKARGAFSSLLGRAVPKAGVVAASGGNHGAAAFAALLAGKYVPGPDERVAVLLCGANTTAVRFD